MRGLEADTHSWLAARSCLRKRADDFFIRLVRVKAGFDPEDIHDLRVSSRRLKEGLEAFAGCLRRKYLEKLRKRIKALTNSLGAIRNCDEALLFFSEMKISGKTGNAARMALLEALQLRRSAELETLETQMADTDPACLAGRVNRLCTNMRIFDPDKNELFQPVAVTLIKAVQVREEPILAVLQDALAESGTEARHRLRISVKRFRYRLELMAPLATKADYDPLYASVKGYQEILGKMHDLDVFKDDLEQLLCGMKGSDRLVTEINRQQQELFSDFLALHEKQPLPQIMAKVRRLP